jgi:hypothetical protein
MILEVVPEQLVYDGNRWKAYGEELVWRKRRKLQGSVI